MKKIIMLCLTLCIGCGPAMARKPLVYNMPDGRNYSLDLSECERFAETSTREDPLVGQGAVEGGIGGLLLGAALGAIIGGALGMPGTGAGWGAGYGGVSGAASGMAVNAGELERRQHEATIICLRARGYQDASY